MRAGLRIVKIILAAAVLVTSALLVTGCWNSRELNKLAIVTAMAIDKTDKDEYKLAFQVVMPGELSNSVKGGGGGAPFSVYTVKSKTLFEGIRKASKQVPRQLFFSHIQVVILGERLAKSGIEEIFDFFERSHEVRLTSMLLVARGATPEKLVSTLVPLAPIQADALMGSAEFSSKIWSNTPVIGIDDAIRKLINPGVEPSISGLRLLGNDQDVSSKSNLEKTRPPYHLEVTGVAMFRKGKLVGWLENDKARGYMFVINRMHSTIMNLSCQDLQDGIALEVIKSKTKTDVSIQNGVVKVKINVMAEGNISEVKCGVPLDDLEVLSKMEKEWGDHTIADMKDAIKNAQSLHTDVFGFGEVLQRQHPKQWRKVEKDWEDKFTNAEVSIVFQGQILRTGMRGKSLLEKP
ncbi:Ger(x)C family spore germination protein [Paenibacillus albus]|uniref:Ger(X)C family spore germination protein n=1 Tax=Paenibacillus albus TaxID=2495582 RepID=A0A3Q8XA39_9BACL|nr:Ger(x)C family spore germination protein [Paenibacillus albus]AZN43084.1 Ger(x)C family spore germination protein [Paenibacillus albus]